MTDSECPEERGLLAKMAAMFDVFISYKWDAYNGGKSSKWAGEQKLFARLLKQALEAVGMTVWLDVTEMTEEKDDYYCVMMKEGIAASKRFLILASRDYATGLGKEKSNCRNEVTWGGCTQSRSELTTELCNL
jgi:hydroxypyruvate isomerase